MSHRNRRGRLPALNAEKRKSLLSLYFVKRWTQVRLAIQFRVAQSTVARYIANG